MKQATEFNAFSPRKENITYGIDDKHLTIIEKLDNGKTREVYWIEKSRCRTIEQQLDWLLQLSQKPALLSYSNFLSNFLGPTLTFSPFFSP